MKNMNKKPYLIKLHHTVIRNGPLYRRGEGRKKRFHAVYYITVIHTRPIAALKKIDKNKKLA